VVAGAGVKLYWLDLETTGLYPATCEILEVAVMEADFLDPFNARHLYEVPVFTSRSDAELDPFIVDMHTKNGLLFESRDMFRAFNLASVEEDLLDLIPHVEDKDERGRLAGSSIHFDHGFIRRHMPTLAKRLSHQHYDVSSVALFCRSLGMPHSKPEPAHRAMADVKASITYARQCRDWLRDTHGRDLSRDHTP
jgi:oligoribonuclease